MLYSRKKLYAKITPNGRKNYNRKFSSIPLRARMRSKRVPDRHRKKFFSKRIKIN